MGWMHRLLLKMGGVGLREDTAMSVDRNEASVIDNRWRARVIERPDAQRFFAPCLPHSP